MNSPVASRMTFCRLPDLMRESFRRKATVSTHAVTAPRTALAFAMLPVRDDLKEIQYIAAWDIILRYNDMQIRSLTVGRGPISARDPLGAFRAKRESFGTLPLQAGAAQ